MTAFQRFRRRVDLLIWKIINPPTRWLAGIAPWWVVLETRGSVSGEPRQVPLAAGPVDGSTAWVIAAQGEHAFFAKNIAAEPQVRFRLRGRWHAGVAQLVPIDDSVLERFSLYARSSVPFVGIDPMLVRIELRD